MAPVKVLYTLPDLQNSGYGQPPPRHGLKLLYWFITTCVDLTPFNKMVSLCRPSGGDFGFRVFHNREGKSNRRLLPHSKGLTYYELGNLSASGVRTLPEYVRERYTGFQDKSNLDRLIVQYESGVFRSIYVTRHRGQLDFHPDHTFLVHLLLVRTISVMTLEDFLRETKRRRHSTTHVDQSLTKDFVTHDSYQDTSTFPKPPSFLRTSYQPPKRRDGCCDVLLPLVTCLLIFFFCLWSGMDAVKLLTLY